MNDLVPRSRLAAVEYELARAEEEKERVVDNATIEIERLTTECSALRDALKWALPIVDKYGSFVTTDYEKALNLVSLDQEN